MATSEIGSWSKSDVSGFLSSFDTVMTDCDGVLYRGTGAIPGSPEMIQKFRDLGKKIVYVTNNSAKVRTEYVQKFKDLGYHAEKVRLSQVFGTFRTLGLKFVCAQVLI